MTFLRCLATIGMGLLAAGLAYAQDCNGRPHILNYGRTSQKAYLLSDGSLATRFRAAVNADGMKRAYHRDDVAGGGLISLCNGGKPYPADRPPYNASADNSACRQFSEDYRAIKQAGWKDPRVGAIHWFGVLGKDTVKIGKEKVTQVVPVEQADGSGFYVSPTALEDADGFPDPADQRRYIDAETIPAAVIRNSNAMSQLGIDKGTLGVAIHKKHRKSVPFVVGDYGPRIGEGTFALGRLFKGLPLVTATRKNIFSAHIEEKEVLWVFFGDEAMRPPYTQSTVAAKALEKFNSWGGEARLNSCLENTSISVAQ
jgi:Fungal chitosanase of glycosyl hydrolase group 75